MLDRQRTRLVGITVIIAMGAFISMAISMIKMNERLDMLSMQMENMRSTLMNQVTNEVSSIRTAMDDRNALLASREVEYADTLSDKMTVKAKVSITPKSQSSGMTAKLTTGDESVPMSLEGVSYVGEIDIPIFGRGKLIVVLSDGGMQQNVLIEEYEDIWGKYLLDVSGRFDGSWMTTTGSDKLRYSGDVVLQSNIGRSFIVDMKVISDLDGKEKVLINETGKSGDNVRIPLSLEIVRPDKYHRLKLEVKDGLGYTYMIILQEDVIGEGDAIDTNFSSQCGIVNEIKDKTGKIVYKIGM